MRGMRWCVLLVAMWAGTAVAAGPKELRAQLESSMVVTGTIDIAPDGRPLEHAIHRRAELPPGVVALVDDAIAGWRFEPPALDPGVDRGRARMSLRLVARTLPGDQAHVSLASARFDTLGPGELPVQVGGPMPTYPQPALAEGATGVAYIAVRIDRDGRVADAAVRRVNLTALGVENQMARWRMLLGNAALRRVREWTFAPPTRGALADDQEWFGVVVINFQLAGQPERRAHQWATYLPGPVQTVPWLPVEAADGDDAIAADGFHPSGTGPRLLALEPSSP